MTSIRRVLIVGYAGLLLATSIATAIGFRWSVDPQGDESFQAANRRFYEKAYSSESKDSKATASPSVVVPLSSKDKFYIDLARNAGVKAKIPETVADFVKQNGLKDKKVLEVGAGSGTLRDIVEVYT